MSHLTSSLFALCILTSCGKQGHIRFFEPQAKLERVPEICRDIRIESDKAVPSMIFNRKRGERPVIYTRMTIEESIGPVITEVLFFASPKDKILIKHHPHTPCSFKQFLIASNDK